MGTWVSATYACERCGHRYEGRTYGRAVPDLGPARCAADGGRFLLVDDPSDQP
jgi:hypothetical protein